MVTRWRILGPVEVSIDGRVADIRRPQQRAVLSLLLLNAGRVVPQDQVIAALWAERPPASARTQVQVCVSRIRAALRDAGLNDAPATDAGGYRLTVDGDELDLIAFTRGVERARAALAAGRPADAAAALQAVLALWRGPALTGATGAFVPAAAADLEERRLAAREQLAAAELAMGRHLEVARALGPLVAEHPLRETLVELLMTALAGCGRQAEALRMYAETRRRLVDELGVEPGPALAAVHVRVLRNEIAAPPPAPTGIGVVAAQLPTDVTGFTGREAALRELADLVRADAEAVVISAIGGTAGVGKTSLAVHFAHTVAGSFPDGQLYVNLRGFDHAGRATTPMEALGGFLTALNVPPQRIPADLPARAALFRSLLAGRRVLIVLDNAHDCEQVRPLIPGTPGSLVLVTSRNQLAGIVVAQGARPLTLDVMSAAESRALLARRLGRHRVDKEPAAVDDIVTGCARLPLALAIAAARAAVNPRLRLADLAAELRRTRLPALATGDPATDLRAVFSWSYRALDPLAARLFRLLGLHPGPDAGATAMASLLGVPVDRVCAPLATLVHANLVGEPTPGRYALHDLLRDYAEELCRTVDTRDARLAARHRLYDHYLHVTAAADHLLDPHRIARPAIPAAACPGAVIDPPAGHAEAMEWFRREHQPLLAAADQAGSHDGASGLDRYAWQLAAVLTTYLDRRGHWTDLAAAHATALRVALRAGDLPGQAQAHRGLAIADTWQGRHDDAHRHYRRALELYRALGDRAGQAHTHIGVSWVLARQARFAEAIDETSRALELYRALDARVGQAKALNNLGWLYARVGRPESAVATCEEALALHELSGDRHGAALTWDSLGYANHQRGRYDRAISCYRNALALHRELSDRYDEAEVLANLGDTWHAAGRLDRARAAWQDALTIFEELDHPDAQRLRAVRRSVAA